MLRASANEFANALHALSTQRSGMAAEAQFERALPLKDVIERYRAWRPNLPTRFRRVLSAGRLLFQFIGFAGYAGYFASMHSLMRISSAALLAGTWYAIYKMKEEHPRATQTEPQPLSHSD